MHTFFPIHSIIMASNCLVASAGPFPAVTTSLTSFPSFISRNTISRLTVDIKMQCAKSLLRIISCMVRNCVLVVCVINTAFLCSFLENWTDYVVCFVLLFSNRRGKQQLLNPCLFCKSVFQGTWKFWITLY